MTTRRLVQEPAGPIPAEVLADLAKLPVAKQLAIAGALAEMVANASRPRPARSRLKVEPRSNWMSVGERTRPAVWFSARAKTSEDPGGAA